MDILFAVYSGLACRPADILIALFGVSLCPRDSNPGWGDWRRSFGGWGCFCLGLCFWAIFMSVCFACHATGLDAVQRLEQKEKLRLAE